MSGVSLFFTPEGIIVADGGDVGVAILNKFEQSLANGEASGVIVNVANNGAPIISTYNDAALINNLMNSGIANDWDSFTKETFASALGVLAGIAALPLGPAASLAADMAMGQAFETAYDAAGSWSRSQDWSDLFDFIDQLRENVTTSGGDVLPGMVIIEQGFSYGASTEYWSGYQSFYYQDDGLPTGVVTIEPLIPDGVDGTDYHSDGTSYQ